MARLTCSTAAVSGWPVEGQFLSSSSAARPFACWETFGFISLFLASNCCSVASGQYNWLLTQISIYLTAFIISVVVVVGCCCSLCGCDRGIRVERRIWSAPILLFWNNTTTKKKRKVHVRMQRVYTCSSAPDVLHTSTGQSSETTGGFNVSTMLFSSFLSSKADNRTATKKCLLTLFRLWKYANWAARNVVKWRPPVRRLIKS